VGKRLLVEWQNDSRMGSQFIFNLNYFCTVINKLSITYLILIIAPLFFGCRGPVKEENKDNTLASSVSRGQKYIIDTKESVLTWEGSMVFGFEEEHIRYVYISKGELMIEKGQLVEGAVEVDMNTIEYKDKESKNTLLNI
jgi:hypothetical protein